MTVDSSILDFSITTLPKVTVVGKKMNIEPIQRNRQIFSFWTNLIENGLEKDFYGLERFLFYNTYSGWSGSISGEYLAGKMFMDHVETPFPDEGDYEIKQFGGCPVAKAVVKGDYTNREKLSMDAHRLVSRRLNEHEFMEVSIMPTWRLEMFTPDYFDMRVRRHAVLSYYLPLNNENVRHP